ncbi:MAG: hypothetical protein HS108_14015 [Planctomycetes bacterium]|nr:hypothetical protein [Planctomycetota bacterium]MCL4731129.1 hypothetical protein [Planctomycetota bacterium]
MNRLARLALVAALGLVVASTSLAQKAEPLPEAKPVPAPDRKGLEERREEGTALLGALRDRVRVAFAKTGSAPRKLTGDTAASGCGVEANELAGKHYAVKDKVYEAGVNRLALLAEPTVAADGLGLMKFNLGTGDSTTTWHDSMDALKKANKDITFEAAKDKEKETGAPADPYALYRKKGRNWTTRMTVSMEGVTPFVNYSKTEVVTVEKDYAEIKMYFLDKDKQPMPGMPEPEPVRVEFKQADPAVPPAEQPAVETTEETIKVEAGEFVCYRVSIPDSGITSWTSKKYPGLAVKMESKTMTMELVEFNE